MSREVLRLDSVTFRRNGKEILHGVDLRVQEGEHWALLGPNGAGKSTMIRAIMGLLPTSSGWVKVFDEPFEKARQRVGYVPQREQVDWDFPVNVMDVVMMGRYGRLGWLRRPSKEDRRIAEESLEKVGMLPFRNRQIANLSGGQQQRVFLARALAQQSDLYLMDEPFAGVDATTERAIIALLRDLKEQGRTIIVVHHDLTTAREYFDHILLLNMRLVAFGKTENVFNMDLLQKTYGGRLTILSDVARQVSQSETGQ